MTPSAAARDTLRALDEPTRALVVLSATITAGNERQIRDAVTRAATDIPGQWVEELVLQSYLFAGFPRALNAMREWRRVEPEPLAVTSSPSVESWRVTGEATCAAVYGTMYDRLRENIRHLHPSLDEWMITEGYGKVLSRLGLDLRRRELCIVAACAAAGQDRQLHSHFHGALNVGVDPVVIDHMLDAIAEFLGPDRTAKARMLWARVRGK
ncbi:MAG: carboxymuconolactone decarboxylase family protein [Deltaproteobacteria bacterium]